MADTTGKNRKTINQGDIYWIPLEEQDGDEPGYIHPHVIVQEDIFNHSRIHTVVVCALTTNTKRASLPGNVLLEAGEANLPRQSVVVVSQISSVNKTKLGEYIGSLTPQRVDQILAGIHFLQRSTERESQIRRTNDER
jgi:mRNA interferase MazF